MRPSTLAIRGAGVNSFGAESDGSDAEFYFAVSLRELLPFLKSKGVEPMVNALPCRSIADLNAQERQRMEAEQAAARERMAMRAQADSEALEGARLAAQMEVMAARENAMALALISLLAAMGSGYAAVVWRRAPETRKRAAMAVTFAGAALIGALVLWFTRPAFTAIEDRVAAALDDNMSARADSAAGSATSAEGALICTLVPERSRVTTARTDDVAFEWAADGCVNTRTQYGLAACGEWSRVLLLEDEAAVAVNRYDPATRTFRTDRYLLGQEALAKVLAARDQYTSPACGVSEAARTLGEQQSAITALLPETPNERLVYTCSTEVAGSAP